MLSEDDAPVKQDITDVQIEEVFDEEGKCLLNFLIICCIFTVHYKYDKGKIIQKPIFLKMIFLVF